MNKITGEYTIHDENGIVYKVNSYETDDGPLGAFHIWFWQHIYTKTEEASVALNEAVINNKPYWQCGRAKPVTMVDNRTGMLVWSVCEGWNEGIKWLMPPDGCNGAMGSERGILNKKYKS